MGYPSGGQSLQSSVMTLCVIPLSFYLSSLDNDLGAIKLFLYDGERNLGIVYEYAIK